MSNATNQTTPKTNQNGSDTRQSDIAFSEHDQFLDVSEMLSLLVDRAHTNMNATELKRVARYSRQKAFAQLESLEKASDWKVQTLCRGASIGDFEYADLLSEVSGQLGAIKGLFVTADKALTLSQGGTAQGLAMPQSPASTH